MRKRKKVPTDGAYDVDTATASDVANLVHFSAPTLTCPSIVCQVAETFQQPLSDASLIVETVARFSRFVEREELYCAVAVGDPRAREFRWV